GGFLMRLLHFPERVTHGGHGRIGAAPPHRAAQFAELRNAGPQSGAELLDQIARALLRMGQELSERHSANRPFNHERLSKTIDRQSPAYSSGPVFSSSRKRRKPRIAHPRRSSPVSCPAADFIIK